MQLPLKGTALGAAIRVVVIIIQADFADGENALVAATLANNSLYGVVVGLRFVRMHTLGAPDIVRHTGQFQHSIQIVG